MTWAVVSWVAVEVGIVENAGRVAAGAAVVAGQGAVVAVRRTTRSAVADPGQEVRSGQRTDRRPVAAGSRRSPEMQRGNARYNR